MCVMIGISLWFDDWTCEIIDMEAAFLEAEMAITLYLE